MRLLIRLFPSLLVVLFIASAASAQIGIGFRAGIISSRNKLEDDGANTKITSQENITGYTIGIPIELGVSNIFTLQPEINFQQRGTDKTNKFFRDGFIEVEQSIRREINYLEIPLLFKFGYTNENFTVAAVAGPTFSYAISGKTIAGDQIISNTGGIQSMTAGEYDIDFDREGLKRADFGAHIGLQGGVPLGTGKIILDARYQVGFTNLNDGNNSNNTNIEDYESKAQGYSLTVGYMWTFGKY